MDSKVMKDSVNRYAEIFKHAIQKTGNAEAAAVIVEQIGKDARIEDMKANGRLAWSATSTRQANDGNDQGDQSATERQIAYLKDLGMTVSDETTKSEASRLIDEALAAANNELAAAA